MRHIFKQCGSCFGTGVENFSGNDAQGNPIGSAACRRCGGEGQLPEFGLHKDLIGLLVDMRDKINDLANKHGDILNRLNDVLQKLNE